MKFGLFGINLANQIDPLAMTEVTRQAEAVGMESVWTGEHVVLPLDIASRYPYNATGDFAIDAETGFVDPFITLTHLAAHTSRIRLGTGIMILPQWNPLYLAKQAASLDLLSGGRLLLGLGIGWMAEEFQALGVPFERRAARFADYLTAIKQVWSGEVVNHRSEFLDWQGFKSLPLPVQRPHPPLIIGGHSRPALRRAVTMGDGLFAFTRNAAAMGEVMDALHDEAHKADRDPAELEITTLWNYASEGVDSVARYEELGVSRLVVFAKALGAADPMLGLERFGEAVIAQG